MELRNITNSEGITHKIIHQIDNEGCKCHLCQKVVITEMRTIKTNIVHDFQSEITRGQREEYFGNFLTEFYFMDKMTRKIKIIFPQVCLFDKGMPVTLMAKKRETLPMKIMKNKEKLNAFQIQNFFIDGFVFHNNLKENNILNKKDARLKNYKLQHYNFDQILKNQCIVLVKFTNGTCQMMTCLQLNNLFKSKQRALRSQILYINTMACTSNYNEIKVHINLGKLQNSEYFERAKNQVKMINEQIKPKDYLYIPEREERQFEDKLKEQDHKQYLDYLSLKLVLLYSFRTDTLFHDSLFKYIKDQSECFYLIDVQVYKKSEAGKLWGLMPNPQKEIQQPNKYDRKRPASSPQRRRNLRLEDKMEKIDEGALILPSDSPFKKQKGNILHGRIKTSMNFKLEPISIKKNDN